MLRGRWGGGRARTPGAGGRPGRGLPRGRITCKGAESQAGLVGNNGREGGAGRDRPTTAGSTPRHCQGEAFHFYALKLSPSSSHFVTNSQIHQLLSCLSCCISSPQLPKNPLQTLSRKHSHIKLKSFPRPPGQFPAGPFLQFQSMIQPSCLPWTREAPGGHLVGDILKGEQVFPGLICPAFIHSMCIFK